MQERRNSSALALELRLSCTNPLRCKLPTMLPMTTHLAVPTLDCGGDFDEETNPVGFAENNHTATKIQLIGTVAKNRETYTSINLRFIIFIYIWTSIIIWRLFQYLTQDLATSKTWHIRFRFSNHSAIWNASWQHCCSHLPNLKAIWEF